MLESALASAWHHPGVAFVAVAALLGLVARGARFADAYAGLAGVVLLADALFTGSLSPLGPGPPRTALAIAFVLAGDLRVFFLLERCSPRGLDARTALRAATATYAWIPLSTAALILAGVLREDRARFLYFEVCSVAWGLALRFVVLPRRLRREGDASDDDRAILRAVAAFYTTQYALWALGDALVLGGREAGRALRLLGDVAYYGAFLPFAWTLLRVPGARGRRLAGGVAIAIVAAGAALSFVGVAGAPAAPDAEAGAAIAFVDRGRPARTIALAEITSSLPVVEIAGTDPYYARTKRWRAVPIEALVAAGFGRDRAALLGEDFVLRARDGYATSIRGERLLEGGAYVAFADLDVPGWEPIGPQRAHPGPFYLVWSGAGQGALHTHPRPWQLASIELITFDDAFPFVRPEGAAPSSPVDAGFALFRGRCLSCHAINGAGGRVGPDLNVPRNVLEYRAEAEVRAYVRDPRAFRYGAMPSHLDLTEADLDALIAYLAAKRGEKHDPGGSDHR